MQRKLLIAASLAALIAAPSAALASQVEAPTFDIAVSSHFMAADTMASQEIIASTAGYGLVSEYQDDATTANVKKVSAALTSPGSSADTYDVMIDDYAGTFDESSTMASYRSADVLSYALVQDRGAAEYAGVMYREDSLADEASSERIAQTAATMSGVSDQDLFNRADVMAADGLSYQTADFTAEVNNLAGLAEQYPSAAAFQAAASG